jgi:uncharacterized protein (TIGR03083 family)
MVGHAIRGVRRAGDGARWPDLYPRCMTELTDRIIASLASHHTTLATVAEHLRDDQLTAPSGASEWTIAQVFSHLGSAAELGLPPLAAAVSGEPTPARDNQAVWDRWNAMPPGEQATGFVEHHARLVEFLTGLTPEQRDSARVDLGFLPEPVPLSTAVGMRLNEVAQHGWDVRVGLDPSATLDADAAVILLELYSGELGFLLGFAAKADALDEPTEVEIGDYALVVGDSVEVRAGQTAPTAKFEGQPEAAVRLMGGRLTPARTPEGVRVAGNVSLDQLRRVFPGY